MRFELDGMWDRLKDEPHLVYGSGPNYESSVRNYIARLERLSKVGKWRHDNHIPKYTDGNMIDRDWDIIQY